MPLPRHGSQSLFHQSSAPTIGPATGPGSKRIPSRFPRPGPSELNNPEAGYGTLTHYRVPKVEKYRASIYGQGGTTFHSISPVRQRDRFDKPPTLTANAFKTAPLAESATYKFPRAASWKYLPPRSRSASPGGISMAYGLDTPGPGTYEVGIYHDAFSRPSSRPGSASPPTKAKLVPITAPRQMSSRPSSAAIVPKPSRQPPPAVTTYGGTAPPSPVTPEEPAAVGAEASPASPPPTKSLEQALSAAATEEEVDADVTP